MKKKTAVKCGVLFLLSAFWFLTTLNGAANEFSYEDESLFALFIGLALAVEVVFLSVAGFFFRGRIFNFALSVVFVVNLFCLYLCFLSGFESLSPALRAGIVALSVFVAYQFFAFFSGKLKWGAVVLCICGVLCGIEAKQFLQWRFPSPVEPLPRPALTENVRTVEFVKKPNVYFLSFDGLIPEPLAEKFLKISGLSYQRYLEEKGFSVFKNGFSDGCKTKQAFNRLLAFDPSYYNLLAKSGNNYNLVSGVVPSPLLEIFKANGYQANTYSYNNYFGQRHGAYVDRYSRFARFSFCLHLFDTSAFKFGFFGYCRIFNKPLPEVFVRIGFPDTGKNWWVWAGGPYRKVAWTRHADFIMKDISLRLSSGVPQFFMSYILGPGHSSGTYDNDDPEQFRAFRRFWGSSAAEVFPIMRTMIEFIERNDPGAVIYVFGDHGVWVTRKINNFEEAVKKGADADFVLDRYGVLQAFYSSHDCGKYIAGSPEFERFATPAKVARGLVRCLAGGADPFVKPVDYRLYNEFGKDRKYGYDGDSPGFYENYLYE